MRAAARSRAVAEFSYDRLAADLRAVAAGDPLPPLELTSR